MSNSIREDAPILIDDQIIRWLGYSGEINNARTNFAKSLKNTYKLNHICKKYTDFEVLPTRSTLQNENMTEKALKQCTFILMQPDDFRQLCMLVRTEKGKQIRNYYLMIEKILFKYTQYQQLAQNVVLYSRFVHNIMK